MGSLRKPLKNWVSEGEKYEKGRQDFPRADVGKPPASAFYCEVRGEIRVCFRARGPLCLSFFPTRFWRLFWFTGPSGVHVDAGPKDVLFLVTTSKFQDAQAKMMGFLNSALIPDSIKEPLKAFDGVVNKIPELMMSILDERMHQDENFFIFNMQMGTPFYGVIVSEFASKTPHLKPPADLVLTAIAASWKISK